MLPLVVGALLAVVGLQHGSRIADHDLEKLARTPVSSQLYLAKHFINTLRAWDLENADYPYGLVDLESILQVRDGFTKGYEGWQVVKLESVRGYLIATPYFITPVLREEVNNLAQYRVGPGERYDTDSRLMLFSVAFYQNDKVMLLSRTMDCPDRVLELEDDLSGLDIGNMRLMLYLR